MKKKYQITLVVIGCLIVLISLSYAYYMATANSKGNGGSIVGETVTLDDVGFNIEGVLEFSDLDIYPGHKNISKIKVTAVGNNDAINYKLVWQGINSLDTPLKYYVYQTTTDENPSITCKKEIEQMGSRKIYYETCEENYNLGNIISEGEINKTESEKEFILKADEVIKGTQEGNIIYYYVVLEYPNLDEVQNIDMGGSFKGKVTVIKEEDTLADITIKKMYKEIENGYEEITSMPAEGYIINTSKSTCSNNAIPKISNNKVLITNLEANGTECNIYFDKKPPLASEVILANVKDYIKTTTPTFSNVATTDEGVYSVSDGMYSGTSYYWRGAATTNHVIFANKCWRIVRINGDGSIRLIYNGTVQEGNTCTGNGTNSEAVIMGSTDSEKYYATSDGQYNNSSYVGWTYTLSTQRTTGGTASNAKTQTEKWYDSNIGNNTTYASKVDTSAKFCNDRNVGEPLSGWSGYVTTWSATGTSFAYAGAKRLYESYAPTLSCPTGDVYTLKVGAITADEVELAGGKNESNTSYYMYIGQNYWTMSPYRWSGSADVFVVLLDGYLGNWDVGSTPGLRPVINLKTDTQFKEGTNGTQNNPYIVQ